MAIAGKNKHNSNEMTKLTTLQPTTYRRAKYGAHKEHIILTY